MLEVRENEIALGKLSSDTAHLHILEGTLYAVLIVANRYESNMTWNRKYGMHDDTNNWRIIQLNSRGAKKDIQACQVLEKVHLYVCFAGTQTTVW